MSFAGRRRGNKVKKGVQFTLMVVGASGTGRTTFVNTLCESEVLPHKVCDNPETAHVEEGIKIKPVNVELEEDGVRIALTIVDTPGFGDNIDNEFAFQEIVGYLERQYDDILAEESRIKRNPRFRDNRVHVLLYFIPPTGHALREMDIELMRRLSPRVNVIPVIGKADSLTPSELKGFKKRIMEDIEHYDIPVYNFPYDVEEDDEETIQDNKELRALLPFAIVGSEEEVEIDGQPVRARIYPWGVVEVDNPKHSDFSRLRSALLNSHLADLKSLTHDVMYETYRTEKLSRTVHADSHDSSILPEELASQSVRLKEEQLRREEEKLREIELKVQREINEKRQELLAKEESLRNLESRLAAQGSQGDFPRRSLPATTSMEIEWETSPAAHRVDGRAHWREHSPPPVSFPAPSSSSVISQRRRSSAANTRPAGPPPNLPIPSLPASSSGTQQPSSDFSDSPQYSSISRGTRSSSFARPSASPNLSAVAAFSQARQASSSQSNSSSMTSSIDDLSDPPPQSHLPPSSFRPPDRNHDVHPQPERNLLSPPAENGHRSEHRPSSRRALTRALELAREAVHLDSTNDNPEAAVNAYAQSVALLSEVMERVRNGEDSTTDGHRRRRRRSVAAQEEEVRRLQNIHDTYADRMNILSIIYSIPPVPYQSTSHYTNTTVSGGETTTSNSPTTSVSPSSDNSPQIPQQVYTPYIPDESPNSSSAPSAQYADQRDSVYRLDESVLTGSAISGLPSTTHPYAIPYDMSPQMQPAPSPPRNSIMGRRKRASSNLPPKPPPPNVSLPPAPAFHSNETPSEIPSQIAKTQLRATSDAPGHRRTPSGLQALEEETEDIGRQHSVSRQDILDNGRGVSDVPTPRTTKQDSPPLPPLPSPTASDTFGTPRNGLIKPPSSPGFPNPAHARPRALSQVPGRGEVVVPNLNTTDQGTIYQRRKTSAPPSTRSASPAESVTSAGSAPQTIPPLPTNVHGSVRSRSSSQPGRRPSIVGGRVSPDQPPPLPGTSLNGVSRKTSAASKLAPSLSNLHLDTLPPPIYANNGGLYPGYPSNFPTTPTSPLPPAPPSDPLLKPYHMMNLLRNTMVVQTGGYVTRRLHVPCEVWSQGGAKLTSLDEKIRVVTILCSALEDLEFSSSEYFGAGNVSSGLAMGIGSIGRKEAEGWLSKLEEFSTVCDHVVANFGKKLGVGEGFVSRKPTWGGKLFSRFDKFTNNGKNLDSPAAYVQGLKKLFAHSQLLDEHTRAILSQPIAPAYSAFSPDLRNSAEQKLKHFSEFFASVVLTFVIRDLSQLLDKYVKKCEKWLAE